MTAMMETAEKTTLTDHQVAALTAALARIERKGRTADHERACWAKRVADDLGYYARRAMVTQLGLSHGTAGGYLRRLEDLHVIPDREVWVAIGWTRLRQVVALEEDVRAMVVSQVLEARDPASGVCPDWRVRELLPVPQRQRGRAEAGGDLTAAALAELREIYETYDLEGYEAPPEIVRFLGLD